MANFTKRLTTVSSIALLSVMMEAIFAVEINAVTMKFRANGESETVSDRFDNFDSTTISIVFTVDMNNEITQGESIYSPLCAGPTPEMGCFHSTPDAEPNFPFFEIGDLPAPGEEFNTDWSPIIDFFGIRSWEGEPFAMTIKKVTPEPSAIIGLLAVGGLGIASKLKKKSS